MTRPDATGRGAEETPSEPERPRVWVHFSCAKPVLPTSDLFPDRRFAELRNVAGRPDDYCSISWDSVGPLASVDLMWKVTSALEADQLAARLRSVAEVRVQIRP